MVLPLTPPDASRPFAAELAGRGVCVHDLFDARVRRTPDAVAVEHDGSHLSYAALSRVSARLARRLRRRGVGAEVPVGLLADHSIAAIVGALGVLRAGGAYLPLDPGHPSQRIEELLRDSRTTIVLISGIAGAPVPPHVGMIDLDSLCCVAEVAAADDDVIVSDVEPENVAAVIYTSGSTGRPKALQVPHRAICTSITQGLKRSRAGDLQRASISVVAHFTDAWMPLVGGAIVHIVGAPQLRSAPALAARIVRCGTSQLVCAPSHLAQLLDGGAEMLAALRRLNTVMVSGEALTTALADRFMQRCPGVALLNAWGSSEASGLVCMARLTSPNATPAGTPRGDTEVWVLDARWNQVPPGEYGELYVGGPLLARGYLHQPAVTAQRFIAHPFGAPGKRLYRTGDVGRMDPVDGLYVAGRTDCLVKVRGLRVDLSEVERVLEECATVRRAVVVLDTVAEEHVLTAAVVPATGDEVDRSALRDHLARRLPAHMVPSRFVMLRELPLLPNGKLDRQRVSHAMAHRVATPADRPPTATERILLDIWCEVLKCEAVALRDNFFEIGGDSIRGMRVVARAAARGLAVTMQQLVAHATVEELAHAIESGTDTAGASAC